MSTIVSPDNFFLNGISSATVGLFTDTPPVPPMPKQRYSQYQITADTDFITPDDSFESVTLSIKCYTFFNENFNNNSIYSFLVGAKTLQISRFDGYYYKVQSVSLSAPSSIHNGGRINYKVDFLCEPFKYSSNNEMEDVTGNNIVYAGTRYSKPLFLLEGSGDVSITVNGYSFSISSISGQVAIDSQKCLCYTSSTIINNQTQGRFPILNSGNNSFSSSGDITRIVVQKNTRWY